MPNRDPALPAADILDAPPQARTTPARRWEPPSDRPAAPEPSTTEPQKPAAEKPMSAGRRRLRWALFLLLPIALIVGGYLYVEGGASMSTDDAYVQADRVGLSTDVSGMVKSIEVKDNQHVAAGQVLFRLDPLPFQLKLNEAEAQLGVIADNFNALKENYRNVQAQITHAEDQVVFDQLQYQRQSVLAREQVAAQTALDQARLNLQTAQQSLVSLKAQLAGIVANLDGNPDLPVEQYPDYRQALAARNEAAREYATPLFAPPTPAP
jgi:membrane fusion protein (multidrug efflux system)